MATVSRQSAHRKILLPSALPVQPRASVAICRINLMVQGYMPPSSASLAIKHKQGHLPKELADRIGLSPAALVSLFPVKLSSSWRTNSAAPPLAD